MNIRKADVLDIDKIMRLYNGAREFMKANGNPTQWGDGYPQTEVIEADIQRGDFYVCEEDGRIVGAFAFIMGEDPTYQIIENGSWSSNAEYGTIHRLVSDGSTHGIAKACFDYCSSKSSYLRIDTHADNKPMQAAILKYGFKKCGIIYVRGNSARIAFDYVLN